MSRHGVGKWDDDPDDQQTYQMSALGETYQYGERLPLRRRLADPVGELEQVPFPLRRRSAGVLLLATAEMSVIARHGDGSPWWVLVLAVLLRAPLHAAVAAALLALLGRLAHMTARLFGGAGDPDTTTELVVLFAAAMAFPAGIALLLWGGNDQVIIMVELILSVVTLVLGVRLLARLEALSLTRAAVALVLPGILVITIMILLTLTESYLLPDSWRLG